MSEKADGAGWLVLPKKIGFLIVLGGFAWFGQTMWSMSEFKTMIQGDLAMLKHEQAQSRLRGDDLRVRTSNLESQRVDLTTRLTRLEEGQRVANELLREIREDMRRAR